MQYTDTFLAYTTPVTDVIELKPGCEITTVGPITKITFAFSPDYDDWILGLDATAEQYPSALRMWVLNKGLSMTADELRAGSRHAQSLFPADSKLALVSPTDIGFGLSRMYEVYRGEDSTNVMVFRGEQEAEHWLLQKP